MCLSEARDTGFIANCVLAELALQQEEQKPDYSICLLRIVAAEDFGNTVRLASALCFKNFLKRNWTVSGYWLPYPRANDCT